jgi:hypothetical protein
MVALHHHHEFSSRLHKSAQLNWRLLLALAGNVALWLGGVSAIAHFFQR